MTSVLETGLLGCSDAEVFGWSQANGATIITYDADFADARLFPLGGHHGIIRLKDWPTTTEKTREALTRLFAQAPCNDLAGCLVIVDND